MLNFEPVRAGTLTIGELCADLTIADLRRLTDDMVDRMQGLVSDCHDADVTFEPEDPDAEDTFAEDPTEVTLAWTLGHVIVHTTASAEESAFLAAELARGVPYQRRRSRAEVPWRSVTTIAQCRRRLEESRRMRLASLDLWPDPPHLDNLFPSWDSNSHYNAIVRFVLGLMHDDSHLGQIVNIIQQAKASGPRPSDPQRPKARAAKVEKG